jgi:hypothetical protein
MLWVPQNKIAWLAPVCKKWPAKKQWLPLQLKANPPPVLLTLPPELL